jgi:hypothetical protein
MAPHTLIPLSGTFVALLVVELVIFFIVGTVIVAIKDLTGKKENKEKKEPGKATYILAAIISYILAGAFFFYYLLNSWTIP